MEFILRYGDLDSRVRAIPDSEAMLMGSRVHRKIQGGQGASYTAEYALKDEIVYDGFTLCVEGRADGIFETSDTADYFSGDQGPSSLTVIDEIKGVMRDVNDMTEPDPVHLAQARVYSAIYMDQNDLDVIGVRMTYVTLDEDPVKGGRRRAAGPSDNIRFFTSSYSREENLQWYRALTDAYYKWLSLRAGHIRLRNESMKDLSFPFDYRKGQKKLVASVYHAIEEHGQLFIEAPTGVGKTMAVLYPAVRALGEGYGERLFYLTAKAVTRAVATSALEILSGNGLKIHYTVLMAKEKICPMHEVLCNPDDCPYAKGHFDRINDAVFDLLERETVFDEAAILKMAEERRVCPFELMLDTAVWTDAVICDYNYAFDPNVRLKRFFGDSEKGSAILLIDEAHNLVERGREMFSASLKKADVIAARKLVKTASPKLHKELGKLNKKLLAMKHLTEEEETGYRIMGDPEGLDVILLRTAAAMQEVFETSQDHHLFESLSDFYFSLRGMLSALERYDDSYLMYTALEEEDDFTAHIACINPAGDLQAVMEKAQSTVLFSATLLPIDYYKKLLGGNDDAPAVYAETPFHPGQRRIFIGRHVSTVYKARGPVMYDRIAGYIHDTVTARRGNYMAFFPSYNVMEEVLKVYRAHYDEPDVNWVVQGRGMGEMDREIFLENFYEDPRMTLVGFCVMGGIFAEGIDLIGTRLIGAIVVGTGLPQISPEREILRRYYDERGMDGFGYAYRIPGMNKVLQAAGRVIRTAEDKGVIVLLDDRFLRREYDSSFPREWSDRTPVEPEDLKGLLRDFWEQADSCPEGVDII